MTGPERVDQLALVWRSLDELCSGLSEAEWALATDCPGWSVQDQLSHIVGAEATFLGRPLPDHQPPPADHVRNPFGVRNEIEVDYRRSWPPARVLEEFREVTAARLAVLRGLDDDGFAAPSWTPIGDGTVADLLGFRVYDSWVHEQDIRQAVGRPGHLDGPVAEDCVERTLLVLPRIVARDAGVGDGATVAFALTGPLGRTAAVTVENRRGRSVTGEAGPADVTLTLPTMVFLRLAWGRLTPAAAMAGGEVRIDGDAAMGGAVVDHLRFLS